MEEFKKKVLKDMIHIYCKGNHKQESRLCDHCRELHVYAEERIEKCPQEGEAVCSTCTIHCYTELMRDRIRRVMRYSGPRYMLAHPINGFKYIRLKIKGNRK